MNENKTNINWYMEFYEKNLQILEKLGKKLENVLHFYDIFG